RNGPSRRGYLRPPPPLEGEVGERGSSSARCSLLVGAPRARAGPTALARQRPLARSRGAAAPEVTEGAIAPLEGGLQAVAGEARAPLLRRRAVLAHRLHVRTRDEAVADAHRLVLPVHRALGVHEHVVVDVRHAARELLGELAQ